VFTRKTYFIIHGFNGAGNNDWVLKIKDNILATESVNVFAVNWSVGASGLDYFAAAANAKTCGTAIGNFISRTGITATNVHCIGHSLGAHVCGFSGKVTKLGRITGMDPAGPSFRGTTAPNRLDKTDAAWVDVMHVDQLLGIQDAIGHKDFYPNGGAVQPGCFIGKKKREMAEQLYSSDNSTRGDIVFDSLACSHSKVTWYYAESISSTCKFSSIKCTSYDDFKANKCPCSAVYGCSRMGHKADLSKEEGKFYLYTNTNAPYCQS